MKTFFTADTHFFHKGVIEYSNRPFKDPEEMNEELIRRWNAVVSDKDEVYHLGDFSFGSPEKSELVACRLKGKKHLIKGNHDHKNVLKRLEQHFVWIKDVHMMTVQGYPNSYAPVQPMSVMPSNNQMIWLSHYAHRKWPQKHYGVWHLYGHSHGRAEDLDRSTDVGVDCWVYAPVSFEELKERFKNVPLDNKRGEHNREVA
jgi:calcineurin-like phosphoesterase family protein